MDNRHISLIFNDITNENPNWGSLKVKDKRQILTKKLLEYKNTNNTDDKIDIVINNVSKLTSNKKFSEYKKNPTLFFANITVNRKKKKSKNYFTQETEDAIVRYNKVGDEEKSRIYKEYLEYPFNKLVENIIHTFKFYYLDVDTIEELQHEIIIFLLQKSELYDSSKGKAYSYFGTITKRYLIAYNNKNYNNLQTKENLLAVDEDETILNDLSSSYTNTVDLSEFLDKLIEYVDCYIDKLFPKTKDKQIADAILKILSQREYIDIFNKKAIYIYLKSMVDAETFQITRVINKYKDIYLKLYNEYYDTGDIKI